VLRPARAYGLCLLIVLANAKRSAHKNFFWRTNYHKTEYPWGTKTLKIIKETNPKGQLSIWKTTEKLESKENSGYLEGRPPKKSSNFIYGDVNQTRGLRLHVKRAYNYTTESLVTKWMILIWEPKLFQIKKFEMKSFRSYRVLKLWSRSYLYLRSFKKFKKLNFKNRRTWNIIFGL